MRSIAVVDCETDPFRIGRIPVPFLWGYYNGEVYKQFESTKAFAAFLRKQNVIAYAHNGGRFDWHFLLHELEPYDDVMIINGRIAKCYIGMCECRDSYNILPVPLSAYKKDAIDYDIMERGERHKPHNWKKICAYLRSDCVYLYELVSGFISIYGLQITQASAAMSQWKKLSGNKVPQSTQEYYNLFAPYYYGGRVECFDSGIIEKEFEVIDINSAYPFAMMQEHPYGTEYSHVDGYEKGADFYRVRCISNGAFPFRGLGSPEESAGLRFPADDVERDYTITGWEFDAAKDTKTIRNVKVLESYSFMSRMDFRQYIEHFYKMRLEAKAKGNEAESLFAKLLMNSLYGKFSSNPATYKQYMIVPIDVISGLEDHGWEFGGEFGPWGLAQAPLDEGQQRFYNVATGASITGFVRAMLWRAICDSKGVLYCDTDSIATERKGNSLVLGDRLGEWKLEGRFDKAGIGGKKLYIFRGVKDGKGKRIIKTASKGARLSEAELWQVAKGTNILFRSDAPTFSTSAKPRFVERNIKNTAPRKVNHAKT